MASEKDKQKAEELKREDPEVRKALEQTAGQPAEPKKVEAKHKVWVGTYLIILVALGVLYYFVRHNTFSIPDDYLPLADRLNVGLMSVTLVLVTRTLVKGFLIEPLT